MFAIFPAPYVAGAALTTLSFKSSNTSTLETIDVPSDVVSGDLMILSDSGTIGGSAPATVIPSGFTSIVNTSGANGRQIISYKISNGTEASSTLTGMNGTFTNRKIIAVFQGDSAITSVNISTPTAEYSDANPSSQSILASSGNVPLIAIAGYSAVNTINPRTWIGSTPSELNSAANHYLLYGIFNSSPADITIDMDDETSTNILQGFYIEAT